MRDFVKSFNFESIFFSLFLFCVTISFGPLRELDYLKNMPGDLIDSRLNNYFLENIYHYLMDGSNSLYQLAFFYPYPFVSGFSDNLFGASPLYIISRYLGLDARDAFQIWYLVGYLVNFLAAYYALKKFSQSNPASAIGAIFFTFGLPVTAQMGHPQLQYRFGIPLAIVYFYQFLETYNWHAFIKALFWLYWQFLCSIYLGFFASIYMMIMICSIVLYQIYWLKTSHSLSRPTFIFHGYLDSYNLLNYKEKVSILMGILLFILAIICLFYPYLKVASIYGFKRQWVEVFAMLPTISSYFISDYSHIWGIFSKKITGIQLRWEQQLFIGLVPLLIITYALYLEKKLYLSSQKYFCLFISFLLLMLITLRISDYSLWYYFYGLPLFSAIRAVSRIGLFFLFPVALFLAAAVDILIYKKNILIRKNLIAILALILVIDVCSVRAPTSLKLEWQERMLIEQSRLPKNIPENSILFLSQRSLYFESEEIDAMLVAQEKNLPTLNGHSGAIPHHFHVSYGDDCAEYPRRIILYLDFIGEAKNKEAYRQIARRVLPVGFTGCEEAWRSVPPMTLTNRALTEEEISKLSLHLAPKSSATPPGYLRVRIINHGDRDISALSSVDQNLRLAWRMIGADGQPKSAWTAPRADLPVDSWPQGYRRDLPGDIAAKGHIDVLVQIPERSFDDFAALEFSIIQEATIWGFTLNTLTNIWSHDVGVATLIVNIGSE